ncbi:hypothetical protein [Flexivirga sp.]|uniref:hypothetical protein n=1 Tax=Flexivirga sp. TaxID=1962927 RepID=UPI003F7F1D47
MTDPVLFDPVPVYPAGSVAVAFKVKPTEIDSVVRAESVAPGANGAVNVMVRLVGLSTLTLAVPPVIEKTPMLAMPEPVMLMTVPAGIGAVGPAVSVKPGPTVPSTPQVPLSWNAPTSVVVLAEAAGAAAPTATTGTDHAAPLAIVRRLTPDCWTSVIGDALSKE